MRGELGMRMQTAGAAADTPRAMLKGPNAPNPQMVADAVVKLIATPVGQRPLRTVVDAHPEGVEAINRVCEQVLAGTLGAMGLGGLVQVAVREQAS